MSLEVKICGINSIEAAQAAKIADFVGFVFYPRSPRYINGKKAQELSTYLPKSIKKVGILLHMRAFGMILTLIEYGKDAKV